MTRRMHGLDSHHPKMKTGIYIRENKVQGAPMPNTNSCPSKPKGNNDSNNKRHAKPKPHRISSI